MTRTVQTNGSLFGHAVRKARKQYACDGWTRDAQCSVYIKPGDYYVEGDPDIDRAGGFGRKRFCAGCCKQEVLEAA